MPEGDTLHKLAAGLRPQAEGRPLSGLWLRDRGWVEEAPGWLVEEISALGKHLLVALRPAELEAPLAHARGRQVLHVHLGMHGRVRAYDPRADGGHPSETALRLELGDRAWRFRRTATAELLRGIDLAQHPSLSRLGPDLLEHDLDLDAVIARARQVEPRTVSDLLLDQRVACGIGNVYRCEALFLEGSNPWTKAAEVDDALLRRLYTRARTLMRWNLGPWRRTTVRPVDATRPLRRGERRTWVYGRAGFACLRCQTELRASRAGDAARATFWCPRCQPRRGPRRRRGAHLGSMHAPG